MTAPALSVNDLEFITESLEYTKLKFENYTEYPSQEFRKKRIEDVVNVLANVNAVLRQLKKSN